MFDLVKGLVVTIAVITALLFGGYYAKMYFGPKNAALDRAIFKESAAYNDGMIRDLENLMLEYQNSDAAHQDAIRSIVIHRFSVYETSRLPSHLASFKNSLKGY